MSAFFDITQGIEENLDASVGRDVQRLLGPYIKTEHLPRLQFMIGVCRASKNLKVRLLVSGHTNHVIIGLGRQWRDQENSAPSSGGQQLFKDVFAIIMEPDAAVARQDGDRFLGHHFGTREILVTLDLGGLISFKGEGEFASG